MLTVPQLTAAKIAGATDATLSSRTLTMWTGPAPMIRYLLCIILRTSSPMVVLPSRLYLECPPHSRMRFLPFSTRKESASSTLGNVQVSVEMVSSRLEKSAMTETTTMAMGVLLTAGTIAKLPTRLETHHHRRIAPSITVTLGLPTAATSQRHAPRSVVRLKKELENTSARADTDTERRVTTLATSTCKSDCRGHSRAAEFSSHLELNAISCAMIGSWVKTVAKRSRKKQSAIEQSRSSHRFA